MTRAAGAGCENAGTRAKIFKFLQFTNFKFFSRILIEKLF